MHLFRSRTGNERLSLFRKGKDSVSFFKKESEDKGSPSERRTVKVSFDHEKRSKGLCVFLKGRGDRSLPLSLSLVISR